MPGSAATQGVWDPPPPTKAAKKPAPQQSHGPNPIAHDLVHWFDLAGPDIQEVIKGILTPPGQRGMWGNIQHDLQGIEPPPKPAPGKAAGGKSAGPALTPAELQQQEIAAIEANPFTQMGNDLAAAQAQETNAALSYLGPAAQANASAGAENMALSATGETGNAQAQGWLGANIAQANSNDSPMAAALAAYQKAYAATEPSVLSANQQMGEANALAEQVAPADAYLQLAGGSLGSSTYKSLSPGQTVDLPPALQYYLGPKGAAVGGVTGGSAAIPSTGAILSGATASGSPAALSPGTGAAPG